MNNVVRLPDAMIAGAFGPRESTPELRSSLRKASIKSVRDRLAEHSRISAKTWILIGKELIGEKKRADADAPGLFASLFGKNSREWRDTTRFPFSHSTAKQLICIALSPVTSCNSEKLPASWRTLYSLSRLPSDRLSAMLESGAIHPMMTGAEAAAFVPRKPTNLSAGTPRRYMAARQHFLSIKKPTDRAAAFLKLLSDCGLTLKQLRDAS